MTGVVDIPVPRGSQICDKAGTTTSCIGGPWMAIEPPSAALLDLLQSLQLATSQQVLACQRFAKALCLDLPAFDSVWIDALVQGDVLTPFQAKGLVESPDRLRCGAYVLVDRLPHDGWPVRYLARSAEGREPVTMACLSVTSAHREAALQRMGAHLHQTQALHHRGMIRPTSCEVVHDRLQVVSAFHAGESLDELLVRRGRLSGELVLEIARQLAETLTALESTGALHGDLRLRNLQLTAGGRIQVINSGLVAAIYPQVSIHWPLPLACHQGLAPELIGTHSTRTIASEMYAMGCLLWQLLAGRSPYLPADPRQQMAAHQKGPFPELRPFAPETPDRLAQLVCRLVSRDPQDRPRSMGQVFRELGASSSSARSRLAAFQTSTQTLVPLRWGDSSPPHRPLNLQPLLTAVVIAVTGGLFLYPQAGSAVMDFAGRMLSARQEIAPSSEDAGPSTAQVEPSSVASEWVVLDTVAPLQEQSPHSGRYVLDQAGPYAASQHSAVGLLSMEGAPEVRAEILVGDQPLRLSGEQVRLAHLVVRRVAGSPDNMPLIEVDAQSLVIDDCELISETAGMTPPVIQWNRLDANDLRTTVVQISRSIVYGGGSVLRSKTVPQQVVVTDSALLGTGAFCALEGPAGRQVCHLRLIRSTFRDTGPLVQQVTLPQGAVGRSTAIELVLRQSVLAPRPGAALVEVIGTAGGRWRPALSLDAVGSYLRAGHEVAAQRSSEGLLAEPIDTSSLPIEGLLVAEMNFAGPLVIDAANSLLSDYSADIMADQPPGFSLNAARVGTGVPVSRPVNLRTEIEPASP